jgi:mannose-6-phosphate isomerase-like protein (cupin superfamily)
MNINVSARKGVYDAFDLSDGRVGCGAGSDPDVHDDAARSVAAAASYGARSYRGQRHRAVPSRVAASVFRGPWAYVDHVVLAPGSATTPQAYQEIGEFWYVMNGSGTVKVVSESASIQSGDAVPIQLNQTKSFENTGSSPLELLVVGVARDADKKFDVVQPPARGGRGN